MFRLLLPLFLYASQAGADPVGAAAAALSEKSAEQESSDTAQKETPQNAKPVITKLEDGRMKLGGIVFDAKSRQVRVPCTLNMIEGLLEFAVVHENGKIHESLLITRCNPKDINIVMKLLRYVASEELYAIEKERGVPSGQFPEVPEETKKAARVELLVEWKKNDKVVSMPLADLLVHAQTTKPMSQGPWVYGGSMVYEGNFLAEQTGDIASIFVSRGSLFLYPGKDNFNDDVWFPHTKRLPDEGSAVDLIIQPYSSKL
jgi:hypothetical protein